MRPLFLVAFVLFASITSARVANISFQQLVDMSDTIVVGRVIRIDAVEGVRVATAEVLRNVRGSHRTVRFVAERTWACDMSTANVGETALLCLHDASKGDIKFIAHAGRGRIVLEKAAAFSGWVAKVSRDSKNHSWMLIASLFAPSVKPTPASGLTGYLSVESLIARAGGRRILAGGV